MHRLKLLGTSTLVGVFAMAAAAQAQSLLVLNKEGSVAIIDPTTQKVLGRAPTGDGPHEVVATTDGKLAVASNYGSGQMPGHTLSVIDIASRKEIHRLDISPLLRPHGLFSVDGKVYFTAEGSKAIGRYDPATNRVDWMMGTGQDGTHMVAMSKDRNTIFTSNIGSGTISIFERTGSTGDFRQTVMPVGHGAEGFDVSPDEKQLWAANAGDGTVSIVDIAGKKVIQTFPVDAKRSNRLKFTPDGKRVLISDLTNGGLIVVDVATRKEVKRLTLGRSVAGILVVPDGSRAYVAATNDNYVAVVDLKNLEVTGRISTGTGPDGMDWIASR
ncbi:MAG TPA: YncE family protein [Bryobacteraceae bacterium]|nr:YncE family protein [Bryobacteraceae bacterium]